MNVDDFDAVFNRFQVSAFRLETLPRYADDEDELIPDPRALGAPALAAGETVVEVPLVLLAGLTISTPVLHFTERGTALVRGIPVTDPEALATLSLPVGETAVEIRLESPLGLTKQEVSA